MLANGSPSSPVTTSDEVSTSPASGEGDGFLALEDTSNTCAGAGSPGAGSAPGRSQPSPTSAGSPADAGAATGTGVATGIGVGLGVGAAPVRIASWGIVASRTAVAPSLAGSLTLTVAFDPAPGLGTTVKMGWSVAGPAFAAARSLTILAAGSPETFPVPSLPIPVPVNFRIKITLEWRPSWPLFSLLFPSFRRPKRYTRRARR